MVELPTKAMPILAQTYDELMQRGRTLELIGWGLAVLSVLMLVGGIAWSIRRDKRRAARKPPQRD